MSFWMFLTLWFLSSSASFLALRQHAEKELGESCIAAEQEPWCFLFALFLGPIPLLTVIVIYCFKLYKE